MKGTPRGGFWYSMAVQDSDLPPPSRLIALVIASRADSATGVWKASIKEIAQRTGLGRRTVTVHLASLQKQGWLRRAQPSKWKQQKEHDSTTYTCVIPPESPTTGPRAGAALGQEVPQLPGAGAALGLGRETAKARAGAAPITTRNYSGASARVAAATPRTVRNLGSACDCPRPRFTADGDCAGCGGGQP